MQKTRHEISVTTKLFMCIRVTQTTNKILVTLVTMVAEVTVGTFVTLVTMVTGNFYTFSCSKSFVRYMFIRSHFIN